MKDSVVGNADSGEPVGDGDDSGRAVVHRIARGATDSARAAVAHVRCHAAAGPAAAPAADASDRFIAATTSGASIGIATANPADRPTSRRCRRSIARDSPDDSPRYGGGVGSITASTWAAASACRSGASVSSGLDIDRGRPRCRATSPEKAASASTTQPPTTPSSGVRDGSGEGGAGQ